MIKHPNNIRPNFAQLADEVLKKWKIDPHRIMRALSLLWDKPKTAVTRATIDEHKNQVNPTNEIWRVRSSTSSGKHYHVRPAEHRCTCKDSGFGNICQHRIAVYLVLQMEDEQRNLTAARKAAANYNKKGLKSC